MPVPHPRDHRLSERLMASPRLGCDGSNGRVLPFGARPRTAAMVSSGGLAPGPAYPPSLPRRPHRSASPAPRRGSPRRLDAGKGISMRCRRPGGGGVGVGVPRVYAVDETRQRVQATAAGRASRTDAGQGIRPPQAEGAATGSGGAGRAGGWDCLGACRVCAGCCQRRRPESPAAWGRARLDLRRAQHPGSTRAVWGYLPTDGGGARPLVVAGRGGGRCGVLQGCSRQPP